MLDARQRVNPAEAHFASTTRGAAGINPKSEIRSSEQTQSTKPQMTKTRHRVRGLEPWDI